MHSSIKFLVCALIAVGLTACGGISGRKAPDETQVIEGPSLAIPPDFELRPPREEGDYQAELLRQQDAKAQELITGSSGTNSVNATTDDAWLLNKFGAKSAATSNVRTQLEQDAAAEQPEKKKGIWPFGKKSTDSE